MVRGKKRVRARVRKVRRRGPVRDDGDAAEHLAADAERTASSLHVVPTMTLMLPYMLSRSEKACVAASGCRSSGTR